MRVHNDRQHEIDHLQRLLGIYRESRGHYLAQAEAHGGIDLAPPGVRSSLTDIARQIARVTQQLRAHGVTVDDTGDDVATFAGHLPAFVQSPLTPGAMDGLLAVTKIIRLVCAAIPEDASDDRPLMAHNDQKITVGDARAALRAVEGR